MTTRWGIAATGKMAEVFAHDLALVEDATLAAVGSRSVESAQRFISKVGADGAAALTYDDLMTADVDVIYIATPHPQHLAVATRAIEAGVPVLVEKAFAASLAGAESIVALARERQVLCMEAMWTRMQPVVVRARELIDAGEVGEVRGVQADLGAYRAYDPADRLFAPELGGGAVLDLGVYVISIAQYFLGRPDGETPVTGTGTAYPNGVEGTVSALLSYADGRSASLFMSLESETPGRAVIAGTKGSIELEPRFHHPTRAVVRRNGGEPEVIEASPLGRGYTAEILHMQELLAAGAVESDVMPLSDTLDVQWIMQELLDQLGVTPAPEPRTL